MKLAAGLGVGMPRSAPPKMPIFQASVGIAARLGYFFTLSPAR